jgi:hypothetical protein
MPSPSPEELLEQLYRSGTPFSNDFQWQFEEDRWAELLICSLPAGVGIDPVTARASVDTLKHMRLIEVDRLVSASQSEVKFINQVFVKHGCEAAQARKATKTIISLAKVVERNWSGYVQRFFGSMGKRW